MATCERTLRLTSAVTAVEVVGRPAVDGPTALVTDHSSVASVDLSKLCALFKHVINYKHDCVSMQVFITDTIGERAREGEGERDIEEGEGERGGREGGREGGRGREGERERGEGGREGEREGGREGERGRESERCGRGGWRGGGMRKLNDPFTS